MILPLAEDLCKLHGFSLNLWRLLFKRSMGPRFVELREVEPILRFLHPIPTDNLVQVKEGNFLVVLRGRSLPPSSSIVGRLLSVLVKIFSKIFFK